MSEVQPSIKLDKVNQWTKDLIFGSVRIYQSLLPTISSYYNIPISIIYIILAFYYEYEQFDINDSNLELSDDGKIINVSKEMTAHWCNAYGKIGIESLSGVCCYWTIKCIKKTNNMFIGISTHRNMSFTWQYQYDRLFYALFSCGELRSTNGSTETSKPFAERYGEGDTVTMDLNLKKKELSFDINGKKYGVAFKDIRCDTETKYYLAISATGQDHKMGIVEFRYY